MNKIGNKLFLTNMKKYHKNLAKIYLLFLNNNYDEFDICNITFLKRKSSYYDKNIRSIDEFCDRASFITLSKIIFIRLLEIYKKDCKFNNFSFIDKEKYIQSIILNKKLSNLFFENIKINDLYIKHIFEQNDIYEIINFKFNEKIKEYSQTSCLFNKKIEYNYNYIIRDIIEDIYKFEGFNDLKIIGNMYENIMNRKLKKSSGKFYTPSEIIDTAFNKDIYNVDIIANPYVTIADICCGSGYFLSKAYDILKDKFIDNIEKLGKKYKNKHYVVRKNGKNIRIGGMKYWTRSNIHNHIMKNCLYASDIDVFALQITFIILIFKDVNSFVDEVNIIKSNSLIKWENNYNFNEINSILNFKDDVIKKVELEKINDFWKRKFDIIIGNPPWVSLNRKQKQLIPKPMFQYYIDNYNVSTYSPNLFEFFFKRSIEKVKEGGVISLVIPANFKNNIQYSKFRYDILSKYSLKNLIFDIKFPYIIIDVMIITIKKVKDLNNIIKIKEKDDKEIYVKQNIYLNNKNYEFDKKEDFVSNIKEKIISDSKKLGDISTTFTGFIGLSKKIQKKKNHMNEVPVYRGRNIKKYLCSSNYYYEFKKDNLKGGTKDLRKLKSKYKILVRKTGENLVAAYDDTGFIIEQSLYGIVDLRKEFEYKYILAVLNSKLINWYYKNYLITNKNSTPQIKKYNLNRIPIKNCNIDTQLEIVSLVDELVFDLKRINHREKYKKNLLNKSIKSKINLLDDKILDIYNIKDTTIKNYIKDYN
ncbi:TaqI-like C-terminal specificity domain-containing protein [Clostridium oceanicum]|uniref:site-specific DNA-methyltransferase (adenine-specific) n=1 Tax=Clostridium oceanicum TaxID=1543 RepID=A0ABP3UQM4_9CLOT